MKAIVLVDTSVFCEILAVPNKADATRQTLQELRERIGRGEWLLLPLATIIETGNHIAQNGDGHQRRRTSLEFVKQVGLALRGDSPFRPTSPISVDDLQAWLGSFPDCAARGLGLADLSIIEEWKRECALHRARRISIWSLDAHLVAHDTGDR